MCGIAGLWDHAGPAVASGHRQVEAMAAALAHRGPDHRGVWADPSCGVALAQARLAVLDLSPAGNGPMPWRDERYWITYNGEVYNFIELRRELESEGCRFRSTSDAEVVLAAFERWGAGCLERFIGMFAFAIWDASERRLFLARDRLGKKPLYYARHGGRFAFASELRALLMDPSLPRGVDADAVALYLRFGYVPAPLTILRAVRTLPPAHFAWENSDGLRVERYWNPLDAALQGPLALSDDEASMRLEALLKDAVARRRVSDVPIGAFLSGGIDSSLVVALMQENGTVPARTFSIRFEDPAYDESESAARVARQLGTDHRCETCGEREMLAIVADLADLIDEPTADSSFVPTYLLARSARRYVTVALTGDGGDELFWGYPRYAALARWRWLMRLPLVVRRVAAAVARLRSDRRAQRVATVLGLDDRDLYSRFVRVAAAGEVRALTGRPEPRSGYDDVLAALSRRPVLDAAALMDLVTYLPDDVLAKVDRATMAVGLEARCPLLDHRVVELAVRLPAAVKWRDGRGKAILRRLLDRRVPAALVDRPKMGFGVPLDRWLRGPLHGAVAAALAGPALEAAGVVPGAASRAWRAYLADGAARPDLLWALFVLAQWSARWLVPAPAPPGPRGPA